MEHDDDILAAITSLIDEYDPAAPAINEEWIRLYRADPPTPTLLPRATNSVVPRVGTIVQRSDAMNRRKQAWLVTSQVSG